MRNQEALSHQGNVVRSIGTVLHGPYEIPIQRRFCEDASPRPLANVEKGIANLERDLVAQLKEVTA